MATKQEMLSGLSMRYREVDAQVVYSDWVKDNEPEILFVAIRKGVYRHGVLFASRELEKVVRAGRKSIEEEADHYHGVEIIEVAMDRLDAEGLTLYKLDWVEGDDPGVRVPGVRVVFLGWAGVW